MIDESPIEYTVLQTPRPRQTSVEFNDGVTPFNQPASVNRQCSSTDGAWTPGFGTSASLFGIDSQTKKDLIDAQIEALRRQREEIDDVQEFSQASQASEPSKPSAGVKRPLSFERLPLEPMENVIQSVLEKSTVEDDSIEDDDPLMNLKLPAEKKRRTVITLPRVTIEHCLTAKERLEGELRDIKAQYEFSNCLSFEERTQLHGALITFLAKYALPPCKDAAIGLMTVHAVMQVIQDLETAIEDGASLSLLLESKEDTADKTKHTIPEIMVDALKIYHLDVRPAFKPVDGVSYVKRHFSNEKGSFYVKSEKFFVNKNGSDEFHIRQIPSAFDKKVRNNNYIISHQIY